MIIGDSTRSAGLVKYSTTKYSIYMVFYNYHNGIPTMYMMTCRSSVHVQYHSDCHMILSSKSV